jgi:hypothetical protein
MRLSYLPAVESVGAVELGRVVPRCAWFRCRAGTWEACAFLAVRFRPSVPLFDPLSCRPD